MFVLVILLSVFSSLKETVKDEVSLLHESKLLISWSWQCLPPPAGNNAPSNSRLNKQLAGMTAMTTTSQPTMRSQLSAAVLRLLGLLPSSPPLPNDDAGATAAAAATSPMQRSSTIRAKAQWRNLGSFTGGPDLKDVPGALPPQQRRPSFSLRHVNMRVKANPEHALDVGRSSHSLLLPSRQAVQESPSSRLGSPPGLGAHGRGVYQHGFGDGAAGVLGPRRSALSLRAVNLPRLGSWVGGAPAPADLSTRASVSSVHFDMQLDGPASPRAQALDHGDPRRLLDVLRERCRSAGGLALLADSREDIEHLQRADVVDAVQQHLSQEGWHWPRPRGRSFVGAHAGRGSAWPLRPGSPAAASPSPSAQNAGGQAEPRRMASHRAVSASLVRSGPAMPFHTKSEPMHRSSVDTDEDVRSPAGLPRAWSGAASATRVQPTTATGGTAADQPLATMAGRAQTPRGPRPRDMLSVLSLQHQAQGLLRQMSASRSQQAQLSIEMAGAAASYAARHVRPGARGVAEGWSLSGGPADSPVQSAGAAARVPPWPRPPLGMGPGRQVRMPTIHSGIYEASGQADAPDQGGGAGFLRHDFGAGELPGGSAAGGTSLTVHAAEQGTSSGAEPRATVEQLRRRRSTQGAASRT
mmetsp:Transcript_4847/g.14726  ORF Transcript_4847/g.14726 Transcript_4847/m.14726 type:complete len:638 (+) Transcript_4847:372-2285(+)